MPVKNAMPYLKPCIDSILQQNYAQWELIAVNDSSTDESATVLQEYANQDARISVYENTGNGIIDALKLAYSKSSGTFITRMDADDLMTFDKLTILANQLMQFGSGHLALGQVKYFSEKVLGNGFQQYEQWLNQLSESRNNFSELYKECVIPSPCWMVFRSDFDACGGFESNWYPEDYDLCFRFYAKELKIIPAKKIIHHWRDYDNRTSRTHVHYADNRFAELKSHYFKELHYDKNRKLILWGAGNKGKIIAKHLQSLEIEFEWTCNNSNKIGHRIYGKVLTHAESVDFDEAPQIIVAVSNPLEQESIKIKLQQLNMETMKDYFFFC